MTAIEETRAAANPGKSIRDGSQPSVDTATRATLPQLAYADAIDAALAEMTLPPDVLETGVRRERDSNRRELFLRLEWLPGHDDLVTYAMQADGMVVEWSHLAGWSARTGADVDGWDVDELADPAVIAEATMHAALCGLRCTCVMAPGGSDARWEHAVYLDIALVAYAERTGGVVL
ncbi:hypothetical protein [Streptomyces antibioticus]|uniref:hypothetical protein n=1 Tax=Streptomyces antibioticus TaxID=1890 RepID=UPI0036C94570